MFSAQVISTILILYYTKFKTSNLIVNNNTNSDKILLNQTNVVYKFICSFQECLPKNKNNSHIDNTTTMFIHRLTYHLSEKSIIKQHLIIKRNNSTNQLISSGVRKVLTDNTIIIYKNNNKYDCKSLKYHTQNLKKKTIINKIASNTGTDVLNIFDN